MNIHRTIPCATTFSAFLLAACAALPPSQSPSSVVQQFYATYLRNWRGGLPSGGELEPLRPFFSDELDRAIRSALDYRDQYIRSHPDVPSSKGPATIYKPPFVDGDYFTGFEEGAKSFRVAETAAHAGTQWNVRVHFWYDRALSGWEAIVIVKQQRGRYVIDDVLFSDDGQSHALSRLSDSLRKREYE